VQQEKEFQKGAVCVVDFSAAELGKVAVVNANLSSTCNT
jgi:hypothetical protein